MDRDLEDYGEEYIKLILRCKCGVVFETYNPREDEELLCLGCRTTRYFNGDEV